MTAREHVEQIYEAERENIYSYLLYFGLSSGRAQEITQDSFLKLYSAMSKGTFIENPRAWLYKVAQNLARRSFQQESVFKELAPDLAPSDSRPNPELELLEKQRRTALRIAVLRLSLRQRDCLHLRVQGLRYREIAEVTGLSISAVGEFLRRAAVRLKESLHE